MPAEPDNLEQAGGIVCAAPCCGASAAEPPREIGGELWFTCGRGHLNARGANEWKETS